MPLRERMDPLNSLTLILLVRGGSPGGLRDGSALDELVWPVIHDTGLEKHAQPVLPRHGP